MNSKIYRYDIAGLADKVIGAKGIQDIENYDHIIVCGDVLRILMDSAGLWLRMNSLYGGWGPTRHMNSMRNMLLVMATMEDKHVSRFIPENIEKMGLAPSVYTIEGNSVRDFANQIERRLCPPGIVYSGRCLLVSGERFQPLIQRLHERKFRNLDADYLIVK